MIARASGNDGGAAAQAWLESDAGLAHAMRREAKLLRDFWCNDSGTSLHMNAADIMEEAADRLDPPLAKE